MLPTSVPPNTEAEAYAKAAVEASFDPGSPGYGLDWETAQRMLAIAWQTGYEKNRAIVEAAQNLDQHKDQGYAALVSYLIRLHEALTPDV